jgi:hypothetical protein
MSPAKQKHLVKVLLDDLPDPLSPALDSASLTLQAESLLGVPPPDDGEVSFTSLNSSISVPDSNIQDQLNVIKTKNEELRKTATLTIQDFKNTSRNLLSKSQLQSSKSSMILHELENFKKNIEGVYEEAKFQNSVNKSFNIPSVESEENLIQVYSKIQDIQKEINEAAERLLESEKMISTTEEKNQILENRIKELEKSLNHLDITEGPESSRSEICMCMLT